jgi:hypothetical protein
MKRFLLAGASLLALLVGAPTTSATTIAFTGAAITFPVLQTGEYDIIVFGGQGGSSRNASGGGGAGGKGAQISGHFTLSAGENLTVIVGGAGESGKYSGGGGGGSFVVGPNNNLLIAAGGGGGAGGSGGTGSNG